MKRTIYFRHSRDTSVKKETQYRRKRKSELLYRWATQVHYWPSQFCSCTFSKRTAGGFCFVEVPILPGEPYYLENTMLKGRPEGCRLIIHSEKCKKSRKMQLVLRTEHHSHIQSTSTASVLSLWELLSFHVVVLHWFNAKAEGCFTLWVPFCSVAKNVFHAAR